MMQDNQNNFVPQDEEDGVDIIAIIKSLWNGRKTVIKWTCAFMVIGLLMAIFLPSKYKVETMMVPQMEGSKSSLSNLASLAGFDLGTQNGGSELSPLIYPQIVSSIPFRKELMYSSYHYEDVDTAVSMFTYTYDIAKPSVFDVIIKYTVKLPFVIKNAISKKEDVVLPDSINDDSPKPIVLTKDESDLIEKIGELVSLEVDQKEGTINLIAKGTERIQTTELALKAQQLLQEEITRFKVEKSQSELDYIQARYDEVKKEAENYQERLAVLTDRSQDMTSARDRIERERIQAKYSIANSIYNELAKQLEQARMKVKKDTPVFTVIKPVKVPNKTANSRVKTFIIWTFLGGVLGCGIVIGKGYMPKLKEMFASADDGADVNGHQEENA